jgi:autotransporter-associated beta strand protein
VAGWGDADTLGIGKTSFDAANVVLDDGTIRYTGNIIAGNADRGFTIGAGGGTLEAEGTNTWTLLKGRNFGITSAEGGTLTLAGSKDGELTIELGGSGGLVKSGSGTWTVGGANTYTGETEVNEGTLLVNNTSGSGTGSGAVTVAGGAKLGGTGTIAGAVDLSGIVSPGASVGTLTSGSQTWNDGSGFLFELADADDGPGTGWDLLSIEGSLDLNGLTDDGFTVTLGSLGSPIADFEVGGTYQWEFVRTTDGVDSFDDDDFVIDATAFEGEFAGGSVLRVLEQDGSLFLSYAVPEPSALLLALLAAAGLALGRRRRSV